MRWCISLIFSLTLVVSLAFAMPAELNGSLTAEIEANELLSDAAKAFTKNVLLPLSTDAVFVAAVKEHNAKGISMDEINKIDEEWKAAEDELDIHGELMGNACADRIREIAKLHTAITETFVMGNQGANVGQNELTGDYYQGDEAKFINSYKEGQGGLDVGKKKIDRSTGKVDQKISLPIVDEAGKVIGAVCFGVDVDML